MNPSDAEIEGLRRRVKEHEATVKGHTSGAPGDLPGPHLAAIAGSSSDAIISHDLNGIVRSWNSGAERMFGYTAAEVIGRPINILASDQAADEMPRIAERLRRGELIDHYEAKRRTKDGRVVTVSIAVSPMRDDSGAIHGATQISRDISQRGLEDVNKPQVERQLLLLIEASGKLLASPESEAVLHRILDTAEQFIAADAYAVWRRQSSGGIWKLITSKGLSDRYERIASEQAGRAGQSVPSEPFAVEDVESFPLLADRVQFYRAEGVRSMLNIPLRIHGEIGGTLVFYEREPHRFTESEIRLGTALGNLAAAALGSAELYQEQVELRAEAQRAEREASFLAEAGAALSSSLDYTATLAHVARSAVPVFADWCAVDVIGEDGRLQRVGLAHQDPQKVEFAKEFRRKYPPLETDLTATAVRTREPVLIDSIPRELLVQSARSEEHLQDVLTLGIKSCIVVPLLSRDRALGSLMFVAAESGRRYTARDLAFAQQLAARAATAIENAMLHASVRASEERLRLAQSAAGIGTWDWNVVTDEATWSPEIYDILGIDRLAIKPSIAAWAELVHPEDRERVLGEARIAIRTGDPLATEFRLVRPDGETRWVLSRGRIFPDLSENPARLLGLNMDITAQKEGERRAAFLLTLDDSIRPLHDPADITATAARLLGEFLDVNRCAYADVEPDESTFNLTGDYNRGVASIVGRYTIQQFGAEFAELCRRGLPYVVDDTETDSRTADVVESYRLSQIRAVISVHLHKGGRFVAGMAVHQITPRRWRPEDIELLGQVANRCWESIERARIERGLRESEARFRQLADAIPAFVWVTEPDGSIIYFNDRWYAYTGLTAEESLGSHWASTLPPQDAERLLPAWQHALRTGEPYEIECRYRSATGEYRWFMARALPVREDSGRIVRWFGTSTDIHDSKRTEEALRKANADLEQFTYSASHDLKEPLRMVGVYSEVVQRKYRDRLDDEAQEYLGYMVQGARRMDMLVRDLLEYTQVLSGTEEQIQPVSTAAILDQVLANLRGAIRESGARIDLGRLPATVLVKDAHLLQLLQNLIGNAIKYRAERPPIIRVSADYDGAMWSVWVHDNGIGIAPEYHDQVFGIFKRLHTADSYPGTGIGLAICQKIVQRYGGRIWVESRGEGHGSRFCFTIPGPNDGL